MRTKTDCTASGQRLWNQTLSIKNLFIEYILFYLFLQRLNYGIWTILVRDEYANAECKCWRHETCLEGIWTDGQESISQTVIRNECSIFLSCCIRLRGFLNCQVFSSSFLNSSTSLLTDTQRLRLQSKRWHSRSHETFLQECSRNKSRHVLTTLSKERKTKKRMVQETTKEDKCVIRLECSLSFSVTYDWWVGKEE